MTYIFRAFVLFAFVLSSWWRGRKLREIDRRMNKLEERWTYWLAYYQQLPHDGSHELARLICEGAGPVSYNHRDKMRRLAGDRAVLRRRREQLQEQVPRARLPP